MSKISIFVLCISFCQIVFSQSLIKHFTAIPSDYVPELTVEERLKMINTHNDTSITYGKFESRITELDTIANYIKINGDNMNSLQTAKSIKENLLENGLKLTNLNNMKKFKQ